MSSGVDSVATSSSTRRIPMLSTLLMTGFSAGTLEGSFAAFLDSNPWARLTVLVACLLIMALFALMKWDNDQWP